MDTSTDVFECSILDATDLEDESFPASDEPSTSSAATTFASKVKRRAQSTSIDKLASMDNERTNFREQLEIEKFEWTKVVEKQKLEMERRKLENDFEIKKLELEQNERVKRYEIEMNFKNK